MKVHAWGLTDIGLKRDNNQDSILLDPDLGLYVVADGMGGHKGGEVASAMACNIVKEVVASKYNQLSSEYTPQDLIKEAYEEATSRVYKEGREVKPELSGMGTTLVVAFCHKDQIYIGNVGDSRAYLFDGAHMWQVTEDHSLVHEQLKLRKFKSINKKDLQAKNIITRSVGFEPKVKVDIIWKKIQLEDRYLICSDGVTGPVTDEQLLKIFRNTPAELMPLSCINAANKGGGDDNISAICLKFSEEVDALS